MGEITNTKQQKVTMELVVLNENDLDAVRQCFPGATASKEIVCDIDDSFRFRDDLSELLLPLNGHPKRGQDFRDRSKWVVRTTCTTVAAVDDASRTLSGIVCANMTVDCRLDQYELSLLLEDHIRRLLSLEFMFDEGTLSGDSVELYNYHQHRLGCLETVLGDDLLAAIFEKVRATYDPCDGVISITEADLDRPETSEHKSTTTVTTDDTTEIMREEWPPAELPQQTERTPQGDGRCAECGASLAGRRSQARFCSLICLTRHRRHTRTERFFQIVGATKRIVAEN